MSPRAARLSPALVLLLVAPGAAGQIVLEAPHGHATAGGDARYVALGDATDDAALDVLVCTDTGLDLLVNDGDGALAAPVALSPDPVARAALVDLDGDDLEDLVTAGGTFVFRSGGGDGSFGSPVTLFSPPSLNGTHFAIGDVTDDGQLDVLAGSGAPFSGASRIDVVPGTGRSTFGPAAPFATALAGVHPTRLAATDLDGDGITDVVAGLAGPGIGVIRVWMGTGGGAFAAPTNNPGAFDFELADVTGDAVLDLIIASPGVGVGVKPGLGGGLFGPVVLATTESVLGAPAVADLDGDGVLDLAAALLDGEDMLVLRGLGGGFFAPAVTVTGLQLWTPPAAGDLDGDGRVDLVAARLEAPSIDVFRNHSYGAGDPFADLGHALAWDLGSHDVLPIQLADGTLLAGEEVTFRLENAAHDGGASAWFVLGASALVAPFKGGVLVPHPDVLTGPFPIAGGALTLGGTMPGGVPAGTRFWTQFWISGVDGPAGFGATTGVESTAP